MFGEKETENGAERASVWARQEPSEAGMLAMVKSSERFWLHDETETKQPDVQPHENKVHEFTHG